MSFAPPSRRNARFGGEEFRGGQNQRIPRLGNAPGKCAHFEDVAVIIALRPHSLFDCVCGGGVGGSECAISRVLNRPPGFMVYRSSSRFRRVRFLTAREE